MYPVRMLQMWSVCRNMNLKVHISRFGKFVGRR